jgi:hypothetical protein
MGDTFISLLDFILDNVEIFFCLFWLAVFLGWYCLEAFKQIPKK